MRTFRSWAASSSARMSTQAASRASFAAWRLRRARFSTDLTAGSEISSAAAIST